MSSVRGANPIGTAIRQMTPPRYTAKEVAEILGKSEDTIIRWRRDKIYVPKEQATFGKITVWLYSDEDIAKMSDLGRRPGTRSARPLTTNISK